MEKNLNVRVPEQLLSDFDKACEANYTNKSEVLRRAMLDYVRKNQKEVTEMKFEIKVDYECDNETWWEAARKSEIPEQVKNLVEDTEPDTVTVTKEQRDEILVWASALPGWSDSNNPNFAPHPLIIN